MTQEQFEVRKQRAERDVFVTEAEEGWRVRSAHALYGRPAISFAILYRNARHIASGLRTMDQRARNSAKEEPSQWQ